LAFPFFSAESETAAQSFRALHGTAGFVLVQAAWGAGDSAAAVRPPVPTPTPEKGAGGGRRRASRPEDGIRVDAWIGEEGCVGVVDVRLPRDCPRLLIMDVITRVAATVVVRHVPGLSVCLLHVPGLSVCLHYVPGLSVCATCWVRPSGHSCSCRCSDR
jgi:hypothetical protein